MAHARTSRRLLPLAGLALATAWLTGAGVAHAHTGLPAGGAVDGLLHPVLGLDHLLAMVAVGMLAAFAPNKRVAWATPFGFLAGMGLGGVLGLAGFEVPLVEVVIAASVVVLGVMVATAAGRDDWLLPVIAVAFGAAHGWAHGAEIPSGALPVAYLLGFVLATAGLHAIGTAAGLGLRRVPAVRIASGSLISVAGLAILVGV